MGLSLSVSLRGGGAGGANGTGGVLPTGPGGLWATFSALEVRARERGVTAVLRPLPGAGVGGRGVTLCDFLVLELEGFGDTRYTI